MELHTQSFYTRTEEDAAKAAELLEKSGGKIIFVVRTTKRFRRRNPGMNFKIGANGVPLEAMRAFLVMESFLKNGEQSK